MKKIIIIVLVAVVGWFLYQAIVDGGTEITGYTGNIESAEGNVAKLTNGLQVEMIGVQPGHEEVGPLFQSKYQNRPVRLIADSKMEQTFSSTDETIHAYIILEDEPLNPCLNKMVLNEYPNFLDVTNLNDSAQWIPEFSKTCNHATAKTNLALYMKQRSFLISVPGGHGTGFFINDNGLAITNYHVMKPQDAPYSEAFLYQEAPDDSQIYSSKRRPIKQVLAAYNDQNSYDITIFMVDLQPDERVPYFNLVDRHIAQGDKCATFGNPKDNYATYSEGIIGAYREDGSRQGVNLVQYQIPTNGGNSGGPVAAQCGCIIAVHEMGDKSAQGLNYGIDILQIRQLLDQLDLKYGGK